MEKKLSLICKIELYKRGRASFSKHLKCYSFMEGDGKNVFCVALKGRVRCKRFVTKLEILSEESEHV